MELYPSRLAAAQAAGISKDTWQRVEEAEEVRESTYAKIDKALGWATGSCVTIAEGGNPVLVGEPDEGAPAEPPASITAAELRRAAFDAARTTLPAAPIGDIDAFSDELVEMLRKAGAISDDD